MNYLDLAGDALLFGLVPVAMVLIVAAWRVSAFWYTPLLIVVLIMIAAQLIRGETWGALIMVFAFLAFFGQSIRDIDDEAKAAEGKDYLPTWMRETPSGGSKVIEQLATRQIAAKPRGRHHPDAVTARTGELPRYGYDYVTKS